MRALNVHIVSNMSTTLSKLYEKIIIVLVQVAACGSRSCMRPLCIVLSTTVMEHTLADMMAAADGSTLTPRIKASSRKRFNKASIDAEATRILKPARQDALSCMADTQQTSTADQSELDDLMYGANGSGDEESAESEVPAGQPSQRFLESDPEFQDPAAATAAHTDGATTDVTIRDDAHADVATKPPAAATAAPTHTDVAKGTMGAPANTDVTTKTPAGPTRTDVAKETMAAAATPDVAKETTAALANTDAKLETDVFENTPAGASTVKQETLAPASNMAQPVVPLEDTIVQQGNRQATLQHRLATQPASAKAARMAFGRTLPGTLDPRSKDSAQRRVQRTEKMPVEIADKMKTNPQLRATYFHMWLESKCSWGIVTIVEQVVDKESVHHKSSRRWLMRSQMLEHFMCPIVVDSMIEEKTLQPDQWRTHPDAPSCILARQYCCLVLDQQDEVISHMRTKVTVLKAQLDQEAALSLLPDRVSKPAWQWKLELFNSSPNPPATPPDAGAKHKKEQAAIEKQRKLEEAKDKKEREKNAPRGQAKEWLKALNNEVSRLAAAVSQAASAPDKMNKTVCSEYEQIFKTRLGSLEAHRMTFNEVASSNDWKGHTSIALKADLESAHEEIKEWKRLLKVYLPAAKK